MRRTHILAIAGLSTALLGTANAEIESSASIGYHSDYVYRGLNLGEDLVDLRVGFSGSTDLADWNVGLGFGIWDGFDEFRAEASVSRAICGEPFPLIVSAGLANTSYSSGTLGTLLISPPDRLEPFVGVSTSLGGLDLSAKAFFNASDSTGEYVHDAYWEVDASYSADLGGNLSGSLSVGMGVWDTDETASLHPHSPSRHHPIVGVLDDGVHYSVTGALQYAASDTITLSAYITHVMNDDGTDWNLDDETFGGASVSVSF